jgi:hypothetical protein
MKKLVRFTGFFIFTALLAACALQPSGSPSVPTEQAVLVPAETATSTPVDAAANVFGPGTFTIDLPQGWDIFGPLTVENEENGAYEVFLLGENAAGSDGPGASRVAILDAGTWTVGEFVLAQCSTCPENPYESVTLGGLPATRTQIGGGGVPFMVTWYFVEKDGKLFAFAIHDPETIEPLEDVIQTIQFE